ncbi:MAG: ATP-binding protein, partial [Armatimonadota bacterium]|nr:ATP-binding protein [Armatimonadota bacterium]
AAVRAAREAAAEARANEAPWLEGAARLALGRVLRYVPGERQRARANFDEAHRLLSTAHPPDPLGMAYVRSHEARLALDDGNASLALSLLREARIGFGHSRHYRALAHSQIDQGWAHLQLRAIGVARESAANALARLSDMGDERGVLRGWQLLGQADLEEGRPEEAARRFAHIAQGAAALHDGTMRAEAVVGLAMAHFAAGNSRGVARFLREAEALLELLPPWVAHTQLAALQLANTVRRRQFAEVPRGLRRLRVQLQRLDQPRLTAECMALCGFELARQGRLRDAAPVLREALQAASRPDAVAWTERFLSTVSAVDVRQWIASLASEIHEHAHLAEAYEALRVCAVAGLHDVRNLASSAYNELELLLLQGETFPDGLLAARDNAFRAGRLAADVEEQIIAGNPRIVLDAQPLNVAQLLADQQSIIERSSLLGHCSVQLEENLPAVRADPRYLARVFGNLRSNSEKYATGCDVVLSAQRHRIGRRTEVIFGFADNGPGVHPEDAEILFNAFKDPSEYRQKQANRGTGFGLHYCKLVVEAHGGRIWVDPRPGEGAAFYFSLPAADE